MTKIPHAPRGTVFAEGTYPVQGNASLRASEAAAQRLLSRLLVQFRPGSDSDEPRSPKAARGK